MILPRFSGGSSVASLGFTGEVLDGHHLPGSLGPGPSIAVVSPVRFAPSISLGQSEKRGRVRAPLAGACARPLLFISSLLSRCA